MSADTDLAGLEVTATWTAAVRAAESRRSDALFSDPFAERLAGSEGETVRAGVSALPGPCTADAYVAIRTRFYDDFLLDATTEGIHQVVLLGAGLDARAYRLPWPDDVELFELDRPAILARKEVVLTAVDAKPRCLRRTLAVNLVEDWPTQLRASGLREDEPVVWLAEGVLPYLAPEHARGLLAGARTLSEPSSSRLGADVTNAEYLDHPWTQPFRDELARHGTPWRFGVDDAQAFFASTGWHAVVRQPGDPEAGAARWPFPVSDPSVPGFPRSFLVAATPVRTP